MELDFAILTGVFLSLACYTYVYKESAFWRIAEHTFVGVSVGYGLVLAIQSIYTTALVPMSAGKNLTLIGSMILGFMLFTQYSKKYMWMSRWGMAVLIGIGTGVAMRTVIQAQITEQLVATFLPLVAKDALQTLNNILIVIMVCATLFYFTFTQGKGKIAGQFRLLGRYTLMATLGATFGATVLTRMTLFTGVWTFLWDPASRLYLIAIGIAMMIILALYEKLPGTSSKK